MITEYIILESEFLSALEEKVNDHIDKGFQPRGELHCTGTPEEWLWTQVMVIGD